MQLILIPPHFQKSNLALGCVFFFLGFLGCMVGLLCRHIVQGYIRNYTAHGLQDKAIDVTSSTYNDLSSLSRHLVAYSLWDVSKNAEEMFNRITSINDKVEDVFGKLNRASRAQLYNPWSSVNKELRKRVQELVQVRKDTLTLVKAFACIQKHCAQYRPSPRTVVPGPVFYRPYRASAESMNIDKAGYPTTAPVCPQQGIPGIYHNGNPNILSQPAHTPPCGCYSCFHAPPAPNPVTPFIPPHNFYTTWNATGPNYHPTYKALPPYTPIVARPGWNIHGPTYPPGVDHSGIRTQPSYAAPHNGINGPPVEDTWTSVPWNTPSHRSASGTQSVRFNMNSTSTSPPSSLLATPAFNRRSPPPPSTPIPMPGWSTHTPGQNYVPTPQAAFWAPIGSPSSSRSSSRCSTPDPAIGRESSPLGSPSMNYSPPPTVSNGNGVGTYHIPRMSPPSEADIRIHEEGSTGGDLNQNGHYWICTPSARTSLEPTVQGDTRPSSPGLFGPL